MTIHARAAALACAVLLAACVTPQTDKLLEAGGHGLPRSAVAKVPFIAQDEYQCGPAALAMTLRASGLNVGADELKDQVYVPARRGSLQPEMLASARRYGRLAVVLPPRLDGLLAEVAAGHPVIVLQNLALSFAPVWHYAVVIGYDIGTREMLLHSGLTEHQRMPMTVFERTWARAGHWAMVAVRPPLLPITPPTEVLVAAAAALERADGAAALQTYRALVARSPQSFGAWFGLGNASYAAGELESARAAFVRAVELQPDNADAWHNLAIVHQRLGRLDNARDAAAKAVALGGPRAERYRQTLEFIDGARR